MCSRFFPVSCVLNLAPTSWGHCLHATMQYMVHYAGGCSPRSRCGCSDRSLAARVPGMAPDAANLRRGSQWSVSGDGGPPRARRGAPCASAHTRPERSRGQTGLSADADGPAPRCGNCRKRKGAAGASRPSSPQSGKLAYLRYLCIAAGSSASPRSVCPRSARQVWKVGREVEGRYLPRHVS